MGYLVVVHYWFVDSKGFVVKTAPTLEAAKALAFDLLHAGPTHASAVIIELNTKVKVKAEL